MRARARACVHVCVRVCACIGSWSIAERVAWRDGDGYLVVVVVASS